MKKTSPLEQSPLLQHDKTISSIYKTQAKTLKHTIFPANTQKSKILDRKIIFELPQHLDKSIDLAETSSLQKDITECIQTSLDDIQELRRSYSNICEERKKYKDIIEWLKNTLSTFLLSYTNNNIPNRERSLEELHNIYSSAIFEMIKQLKTESLQKACLIKISWESVTSFHNSLAKDFWKQLIFQKGEIQKKHKNQRQLYDKQILEYQDKLQKAGLQLAKRQRYFYQVVKDNRIMRKTINKLMAKVQSQQQSNSYLKEQNIMFYKQNQRLKIIIQSQMVEDEYKQLLTKLDSIEKEFVVNKKKINKVALAQQLKNHDVKTRVKIEREINQIIKRVNTNDFLDLQVAVAQQSPEQIQKMFHSTSMQTQSMGESIGVNTFANMFKRSVSTQFNIHKYRKLMTSQQIQLTLYPESVFQLDTQRYIENKKTNNKQDTLDDKTAKKMKKSGKDGTVKSPHRASQFIDSKQQFNKQNNNEKQRVSLLPKNGLPQIVKKITRRSTMIQPFSNFNKLSNQNLRTSMKNHESSSSKRFSQFHVMKTKNSYNKYKLSEDDAIKLQNLQQLLQINSSREQSGKTKIQQLSSEEDGSEQHVNVNVEHQKIGQGLKKIRSALEQIPRASEKYSLGNIAETLTAQLVSKNKQKKSKNSVLQKQFFRNESQKSKTMYSEVPTINVKTDQQKLLIKSGIKEEDRFNHQAEIQTKTKLLTISRQNRESRISKISKQSKKNKQSKESKESRQSQYHKMQDDYITQTQPKSPTNKPKISKIHSRKPSNRNSFIDSTSFMEQTPKQTSKTYMKILENQRSQRSYSKRNQSLVRQQPSISVIQKAQKQLTCPSAQKPQTKIQRGKVKDRFIDKLPESYMIKLFKKINSQVLVHRNSLLKQQISFEQFIEMTISHNYGLRILTTQMRQKLKSTLIKYNGTDLLILVFRKLVIGQQSNHLSTYYKRQIFRVYILVLQFWANYSQIQNFHQLQKNFITDLFSNFFNTGQIQRIISFLEMVQIDSQYKLFTMIESIIQTESHSLAFMNTIYNLQSVLSCRHAITPNQLVELLSVIQRNKLNLHSKVRTLFKYSDNKTKNLPFFTMVLQLNKLDYEDILNMQLTIQSLYNLYFYDKRSTDLRLELKQISKVIPDSRYLRVLQSMDTESVRQSQVLLYQLVKLQFSNQIHQNWFSNIVGEQLSMADQLIGELLLKSWGNNSVKI